MKSFLKIFALVCGVFFVFTGVIAAQDVTPTPTPTPEEDNTPIKVDTLLYTIPLTVKDSEGRHVARLKKENFTITQDGEPQEIDFFVDDQAPTNVAIIIDTSISTKPVLDNIQKAARDFVKVLRPEDKGLIVTFDNRTSVLSEFTSDRSKLSKAIDRISIAQENGSDMNDAVNRVVTNYFASVKGRKAIIVLTDGIVSGKNLTDFQVLTSLQKTDTLLYPIIFKTATYFIKDSNSSNGRLVAPYEHLRSLADLSAGKLYEKDAKSLKEAFQGIAEELKKQYLVGYYPTDTGKPRRIRIKVDRRDATVLPKKSLNF